MFRIAAFATLYGGEIDASSSAVTCCVICWLTLLLVSREEKGGGMAREIVSLPWRHSAAARSLSALSRQKPLLPTPALSTSGRR